ncbi:hypothetical protein [Methylobacterium sp. NEAU K]|uniref:hypothetical protein n=1 Tax=Methylobacterium sp. NEAU K TaxID=3064946 RepID=UPI002732E54D|nr:hypothetical protein [Methylobacterium sp. NEAU K]MDP4006576.1 hypothetical protein [Methylobacterium sp. NEAU K]
MDGGQKTVLALAASSLKMQDAMRRDDTPLAMRGVGARIIRESEAAFAKRPDDVRAAISYLRTWSELWGGAMREYLDRHIDHKQ